MVLCLIRSGPGKLVTIERIADDLLERHAECHRIFRRYKQTVDPVLNLLGDAANVGPYQGKTAERSFREHRSERLCSRRQDKDIKERHELLRMQRVAVKIVS